jgi:hypothetical protein
MKNLYLVRKGRYYDDMTFPLAVFNHFGDANLWLTKRGYVWDGSQDLWLHDANKVYCKGCEVGYHETIKD